MEDTTFPTTTFIDDLVTDVSVDNDGNGSLTLNNLQSNTSDPVYLIPVNDTIIAEVLKRFYTAFLVTCMVLGIPGNILVIIVLFRRQEKTGSDFCLSFIAILDLVHLVVHVPFMMVSKYTDWLAKFGGGNVVCKINGYTNRALVMASSIAVGLLALDRYYKVCKSGSSDWTCRKMKILCLITVLFSLALNFPFLLKFSASSKGVCDTHALRESTLFNAVIKFGLAFVVVLCLPVVAVCYINVALTIRKAAKSLWENETKRKEASAAVTGSQQTTTAVEPSSAAVRRFKQSTLRAKISFLVCAIFIASYVPKWLILLLSMAVDLRHLVVFNAVQQLLRAAYLVNTFANPFVYMKMSSQFRNDVKILFGRK